MNSSPCGKVLMCSLSEHEECRCAEEGAERDELILGCGVGAEGACGRRRRRNSLKAEASWNRSDMSVTPPVSHVEMCPYVASAAVASESHAMTAGFIFQSTMTFPVRDTSQSPVFVSHITPQYVDSHGVP